MKKLQGVNMVDADGFMFDIVSGGTPMAASKEYPDRWFLARPLGDNSLLWRIKCAWKVLTCRADIMTWREQ